MDRTRDNRGKPRRTGKHGGAQRRPHRDNRRNQGYESNSEINQRIEQLESSGDPLSLAEQIAREYDFEAERTTESSDQLEKANITRLQQMPLKELVEAARIDGTNIFGIYRHVLFPLSLPGFVVVMIWQFTSIWNDFLFAATITSNPATQPITVGLNNLAGSYIVEWNVQMAGSLITALPTLLVYILLGRFFMRGLMAGSLKG